MGVRRRGQKAGGDSWKIWMVGWIFMDSSRVKQIVEGLLIFSIGKEPLKRDKN